jgi:hypothetical protein
MNNNKTIILIVTLVLLLLIYFRYPGDDSESSIRFMLAIEDLARRASTRLKEPNDVIASWNFMSLVIPLPSTNNATTISPTTTTTTTTTSSSSDTSTND